MTYGTLLLTPPLVFVTAAIAIGFTVGNRPGKWAARLLQLALWMLLLGSALTVLEFGFPDFGPLIVLAGLLGFLIHVLFRIVCGIFVMGREETQKRRGRPTP